MNIQLIGYIAGICTTIAFVPQLYKTYKYKKVNDLSYGLAILYWFGNLLWLIYGILVKDYTIMLANGISLIFSSLLFNAKIRFNKD